MTEFEKQKGNEVVQSTPRVGYRLQDVILDLNTFNTNILRLRKRTIETRPETTDSDSRQLVLNIVCQHLFGQDMLELQEEATATMIPHHADGQNRQRLIVSSASSASASQETETAILKKRGHVIDIPGAIEGRDTIGAKPGDAALISTTSGLIMANARPNLEVINLADEPILQLTDGSMIYGKDIYYKADALLLLMVANPESLVFDVLINKIRSNPVIYPYNLDTETQLALQWLAKKANISMLDVNANSPEVGTELTRKGYRYPDIEDALQLPDHDDVYTMQHEEWILSQAAREINYHPDVVPGYVIKHRDNFDEFYNKIAQALSLLSRRYDLTDAWVKPDRGTDGGNQGSIETTTVDKEAFIDRVKEMWNQGGDWVIEAKTNYFQINLPISGAVKTLTTTPSAHIVNGEHMSTISLQLVDGVAWGGNLICTSQTWDGLVDMVDRSDPRIQNNPQIISQLKASYPLMLTAMQGYVDAVNVSERYKGGQVRGGADIALATLGGKFGTDNIIVAVQDYNARANGCETARALHVQAQEKYGVSGEAVTRNITPKVDFTVFSTMLLRVVDQVNKTHGKNLNPADVKLIAVSAGWGQFGILGTDAMEMLECVFLVEEVLRKMDLIA